MSDPRTGTETGAESAATASAPTAAATGAETSTAEGSAPESAGAIDRQAPNTENSVDQDARDASAAGEASDPDPANLPIADFSKIDLGLPEDFQTDPAILESFGKAATSAGLTPNQAKALAAWNVEAIRQCQRQRFQEGAAALVREWGDKTEANQAAALSVVSRLDRAIKKAGGPDNAFSKALDQTGAALSPDIIRGLFHISAWLSEDSIGAAASTMPQKPESPLDGIRDALKKARQ